MKGYIALISILIITAVIILAALSAGLLGVSEADLGLEKNQSSIAYYLALACVEEALQQIHDLDTFVGSNNLPLNNGTCSYTVSSQGGGNRTIIASGNFLNIIRKIKAITSQVSPTITVTSWQEVADF